MTARQTRLPERWLLVDGTDRDSWHRLPAGSGMVVLAHQLGGRQREALLRRLRRLARGRRLILVDEAAGDARRVHDHRELREALLARASLILLSPLYPTKSHPLWPPIPRMRAAALARLAGRQLIALGGMNAHRFKRVQSLGFVGWAGISAWTSIGRSRD